VTKLRVNAFLATLASALSFGGIAVAVTNGGLPRLVPRGAERPGRHGLVVTAMPGT